MNILNTHFDNLTCDQSIECILNLLSLNKKSNVFFLNLDCLRQSTKDLEYCNILENADLVLPDGIGLKFATKIFGHTIKEDCNGTDFSPLLMRKVSDMGYKIFLLGGKEGVAQSASENLKMQIPSINIVGALSGYFNDNDFVINKINRSGADILFVAMGVPVQEKWIMQNREKLAPKLCLGVGALLDYLSGHKPRAPLYFRRLHIEWFWRVLIEPQRMFKRYIIDGLYFSSYLLFLRLKMLVSTNNK